MSDLSTPLGGLDLRERLWRTQPRPVPWPATTTGHVVVFGYSLFEFSLSASASVDLFSGTDASGINAIRVPLGPGMAAEEWFGPQGLWFENGLFCRNTVGSVAGSVFLVEPWHDLLPSQGHS